MVLKPENLISYNNFIRNEMKLAHGLLCLLGFIAVTKVEGLCKKGKLSDWEQFVLDEHNKLRGQHADTPDLCYSESGEDVTFTSQTWADQLAATGMFQHSRGEYGENIAYKSTSGTLPDRIAAYNSSIHRLETC